MSAAALAPTAATNQVKALLELGPVIYLDGVTKENFLKLIERFPEHRMEREPNGLVIIMPPTHGGSSIRENKIGRRVGNWCDKNGNGEVFSPSGGFDLPNGATKSPDVAWMSDATLGLLSPKDIEESFVPTAPDFVAEIRSGSDNLEKLKTKMRESWIANGVRLAWLIDPYEENAWVYRADGSVEKIQGFDKQLSGEDVMPGFVLDLAEFRVKK
ncbi:MAG TPA: Uma2 family endonuclease [Saprospiraceae bacterium]|nr:Uma2 family endonuclease [Saprospiraceae bacterium]